MWNVRLTTAFSYFGFRSYSLWMDEPTNIKVHP
jgi:hypothetical protein